MVTRRAVLKGTAAASIGAIAAAHGAAPAQAAGEGFGLLDGGGAIGGFYKYRDAFQVSLKFQKFAAEIFFKEQIEGNVAVFFKFFDKHWTDQVKGTLDDKTFPNLQSSVIDFLKIHDDGAEVFLKTEIGGRSQYASGKVGISTDGAFLDLGSDSPTCAPDFE